MNQIFYKLQEKKTDKLFRDDFYIAEVTTEKTGDIRPQQMDANEEYAMVAKVGIRFWANSVQYRDGRAKKTALQTLNKALFGDIQEATMCALSSVHSGNREEALCALERLIKLTEYSDN